MSLGFTVDALIPAGRGGGALRMGLTRVAESDWLQPEFDRAAREAVFAAHPEAMIVLPGAEGAASEAAQIVGNTDDLATAAQGCWEDLCVLEAEREEGPYRLTAAALGFPTDWHLHEKMGQPLLAIHAPIHGYAEQLSKGVDHFFATLKPGEIFGRANWFVVANDNWRYMPEDAPETRFAHVTAENAGESLFVRCERQTLRRLPQTQAVLFTIGIAVAPLVRISTANLRRVADAITAISGGEHERRAAPFYADVFDRYTLSRELEEKAA